MLAILRNPFIYSLLVILVTLIFSGLFYFLLFFIYKKFISRMPEIKEFDYIWKNLRSPLKLLIPVFSLKMAFPLLTLPDNYFIPLCSLLNLVMIGGVAYFGIGIIETAKDWITSRYEIKQKDNLEARKIHTQIKVIEQIAIALIILIGISSMLMTFDKVKQLGISILASAGIVGIILGFAAQKSIATLFAGLQIAITQPIRLDDVVIVENEWGWIEEITLTYVVVKIWDLRRLIVPITYFIEKPFQNWTRVSADILGTVFIYTDYKVPVQSIRDELEQILKNSSLFDGKAWCLQVTDAKESTLELRALMSAEDSPKAWDLRCLVREKLILFLQKKFPESLPRVRVELEKNN